MRRFAPVLMALLCCLAGCAPHPTEEAPGVPRLKRRSVQHTGIDFSNQLSPTEQLNILTFEYFYNGAGVGIGDFNRDGLPDIFFTGNLVNSRLYLNRGDLRFEDVTPSAGIDTRGRWAAGVSVVDINADGWPDIYISCAGPYGPKRRANQLYINNQDGSFSERAREFGLADTGHTTHTAFFDYDRDGDLDAYLLTNITLELGPNVIREKKINGQSPNTDRLYRNEQGRFTDVSRRAGILKEGYGLGLSISDINQDGWPDVYVSNDYLSNDLLWINRGDGTFEDRAAEYLRHTSYSAMGNDVADYNNDALPDIVTLDMLPPDNLRRKLMIGAINYDRFRSEMVTGYAPQYMRNTLQLHRGFTPDGQPVFSEIGQLAGIHSTDWSWSALLADMDNDGWKDLLVTNGYPRDITNMDFASYKMNTMLRVGYNQNSKASLLEAIEELEGAYLPNQVFRNRGDLTFEKVTASWGFTQPTHSQGAAVADLDLDGDLDYIVSNTNAPACVYENQSGTRHYLRLKLAGPAGNPSGFGAKAWVYADGRRQFQEHTPYRGYQSSVEPILHFGLNTIALADSLKIQWPNGRTQTFREVAADQVLTVKYDTALAKKEPPSQFKPTPQSLFEEVSELLGVDYHRREKHYADFKVQPLLPHKHSQQGPPLARGDIDGDGREDFFVGGSFRFAGQIFLQRPDGAFQRQALENGKNYEETTGCLLFDADNDGDLDLYLANGGSEFKAGSPYYQDQLYRNDGRGNFQLDRAALPPISSSTSAVAAADYDGDGDQDLMIGGRIHPSNYAEIPRSYLLENQDGRFLDVTREHAPALRRAGRVSQALWTDFDRDGLVDLLLAGEWMPLTFYRNTGTGFEKLPLERSTGWWNSLAAADLDGDGDTDYVAGNLGWNNPYQVDPQHPLQLYVNDFDRNNRRDAVMTFYLEDEEVPVHYRDDMLNWLYPLKKKYRNYTSYAQAGWWEMFPEEVIRRSEISRIEQFSSVWLENRNGQFRMHELPAEAQFAPVRGILIDDYDRDGHPDMLLSGNAYATETATGRYDALNGLLLRGHPEATFTSHAFTETGFYVPGDARGLAQIQSTTGEKLIIAARNGEQLLVFRHR